MAVAATLSATVAVVPFTAVDADAPETAEPALAEPVVAEPANLVEVVTPSGTIVEIPESAALDDRVDVTDGGVEISQPGISSPVLPAALLHEIAGASGAEATNTGFTAESDSADGGAGSGTSESPPASSAFNLSSLPGADKTVFLDFDGHTTTGTYWNSGTNNDGSARPETIISAAYSTDSNAAFSTSELESIGKIWEMVAEDFAPFNVNVTTVDPGADALSDTGDTQYGVRVVISPTSEWYGSAGGVAVVGSFDSNVDTPAFVFTDALGSGYWKYVGEATSHEAGHTFGLFHDGGPSPSGGTTGYYGGHGSGANGWAPIMGVGYQKAVTQWSQGDYTGATETQDDVQILTDELGLAPAATASAAGPITVTHDASVIGVAPTAGATAQFHVTVGAGDLNIAVTPVNGSGNLLARLDVVDGSTIIDSQIASAATGWTLWSSTSRPAGTYTIHVTSTAWQNADTGFPSYASIGEFVLDINAPAPSGGTTTTTTQPDTTDPGGTPTTQPPAVAPPRGDRLTPISPQRLLDTRAGLGGSTRLAAGQTARVGVASVNDISPDASAAVLTVTAVRPDAEGYLDVTPCIAHSPDTSTSTVNFVAGRTVANTSIIKLDESGDVCVYASAATDVLIDATAWLGADGDSALTTRTPERIVDSRDDTGLSQKLVAGSTAIVDLNTVVSADATAISANVTVTGTTASGFVTVFPCSTGRGSTSSVNFGAFEARANNIVVAVDDAGTICIYTDADAHVVVDLTGEFGTDGLTFIPATPERLADSRSAMYRVTAGSSASYIVPTPDGFADGAVVAASVNITAIRQTEQGFVTSWDCGDRPNSSALNPLPGEANANGAIAEVGADGRSCLYTEQAAALIVDLTGWWV